MLKTDGRVRGWRRKIDRLLEALSPMVLSRDGYKCLANILLEEGFEGALEAVEEFKSNAPTSSLKTYRSPIDDLIVIRDEYIGFSVSIEASDGIPLDVYPGRIIRVTCIDPSNAILILSNVDKVFPFVKKYIDFLSCLSGSVENIIVDYIKSGDESSGKEYVSWLLRDGLWYALMECKVVKLDECFALAPTLSGKYSIVDLKNLRASTLYSINKAVSYIILSARPKIKWGYSADKFSKLFSEYTIMELAKLNPALKLVV